MDTKDIKAVHETEEGIVGDPYLPRGKAIFMLQQAHQQRGLLLAEVERLLGRWEQAINFYPDLENLVK